MSRRVRVPVRGLEAGERLLEEAESRYVLRVHRLRPGAEFSVFEPRLRREAEALLVGVERGRARCRIVEPVAARHVAPFELRLLQAVGKGDKVEQVVRDATALGATHVTIVDAERSVPRRSGRAKERWDVVALEAARQCERGDLPDVEGPVDFAAALASAPATTLKLLFHPASEEAAVGRLSEWEPKLGVTLAIGPEGGFSPEELRAAERHGFSAVTLGALTLRTETAAVAALALCVGFFERRLRDRSLT